MPKRSVTRRRSRRLIAALPALACAAVFLGVLAALEGCPSLSALECQGAGCQDGGGGGEAAVGAGGIACGGGTTCRAPQEECCARLQGSPTCVPALSCNGGSDIFCDDPAQCGGAPCWLCNRGGFQGASCNYTSDIVQAYGCTNPQDIYRLCHSTSECDAGTTCVPLGIVPPGVDAGEVWFYGCQP